MSLNVYTPKNRAQLREAKPNKFARRNKSIHYIVGDFNALTQKWTDLFIQTGTIESNSTIK